MNVKQKLSQAKGDTGRKKFEQGIENELRKNFNQFRGITLGNNFRGNKANTK